MARKKSMVGLLFILGVVLGVVAFVGVRCAIEKRTDEEKPTISEDWTTVIEDESGLKITKEIEYEQDARRLNLNNGKIKANSQIDKIFVSVTGIGIQYLEFEESATDDAYEYVLKPTKHICDASFYKDVTLTVEMYAEYKGRCYKVDSQDVKVKSTWTIVK